MRTCIALVLSLFLALCASAEAATYGKIAAVVNGKAITMYDLQREAAADMARSRVSVDNPKDKEKVDEILRRTLDDMILNILLEQEGERLSVKVTDKEVDDEITHMYMSRGMTKEQFEAALKKDNVKLSDLRANYRRGMLRQRIMGMEVGRRVVIRPEEIEAYYNEHKESLINRENLHLAVIVYHPQAPVTKVAKLLKEGKISWLEASRRFSILGNRDKGGDEGVINWDALTDEMQQRLGSLQPGEISEVFQFNAQFKAQARIFRSNGDTSPFRIMTLEEATPKIDAILRNPKAQGRFEEYTKSLRDKAVIEIRI